MRKGRAGRNKGQTTFCVDIRAERNCILTHYFLLLLPWMGPFVLIQSYHTPSSATLFASESLKMGSEMVNFGHVISSTFRMSAGLLHRITKNCQLAQNTKIEQLSPNTIALRAALNECRKEARKCRRWRMIPSPVYFEHAAMLFRQTKNIKNEIKICELYVSLVNQCLAKKVLNRVRYERKAQEKCKRIASRLQAAKNLSNNTGIDV